LRQRLQVVVNPAISACEAGHQWQLALALFTGTAYGLEKSVGILMLEPEVADGSIPSGILT